MEILNMFRLIAGPCVIESEEMVLNIAEYMKKITKELGIDYVFKASFDKANRTSVKSYRGPGIDEGLDILRKVKNSTGLKILTDIHEPFQAKLVAEVVDIIQIPAFLCRQTDLLVSAAETGKVVNIKKGQFLSPWDMVHAINKVRSIGNSQIYLTERGTTFGYNNLVVDMTSILEMKKYGYPVIFDATHSVQKPGGEGEFTGGNREHIEYLAKAALAVGADGLFMEIHPDPDDAKSDGPNMIKLSNIKRMLVELVKIYKVVNNYETES